MSNFQLTKKAVDDLSDIWNYTYETWSEQQADHYYETLIQSFQNIADNPLSGKNYDRITEKLKAIKVNRHLIFYRIVKEETIEITRVLHERMDLKSRISE